jgi:hypothetical protein
MLMTEGYFFFTKSRQTLPVMRYRIPLNIFFPATVPAIQRGCIHATHARNMPQLAHGPEGDSASQLPKRR